MKDLTFSKSTEKFSSVSFFFSSGLEADSEGTQRVLKGTGKVSREIGPGVVLLAVGPRLHPGLRSDLSPSVFSDCRSRPTSRS